VDCDFDPAVTSVPFGGGVGRERHGPRSLLVPTFADELRRQARVPAKVVALGLKPRTAIAFAGRGAPDTIAFWEEDDGTWATSDAFTQTPWPDVDAFVRAHAIANDYGRVWTPLLPPDAYRFADNAAGEAVAAPWGRTFPHPLVSSSGKPDNQFVTAWERSPLSDAFITDLAIHLLRSRQLGTGTGTDFLAISFPSLDLSGHEYGPRSHEVQDTLARVDVNLGRLLDAIETQVGRDYVIGLTSDHGVSLVPEQVVAEGGDAGRISTSDVRNAVNAAVQQALGVPGPHVAAIYEEQVALNPGTIERLRRVPGGLQAVTAAIGAVQGVATAYAADDLIGAEPTSDPGIRAWRLSYVPGRSGDFAFTPKPNWIARATSGTTHGSLNDDDRRVPLVLSGLGIRPGRYAVAATPADVVCTFAALVGIQLPRAQGRALSEALAR
jgi:predicted AlkP superfamily pyrophosphatase or phosphodiesterase